LLAALGGRVEVAFAAPGRANLIGEHTDYNLGFVLPVALDMATYIGGVQQDRIVSLTSLDEPGDVVVDVTTGAGPTSGWGRYVTAVVRAARDDGVDVRGFSGVVASDVPAGAGLSSSAALEVVIASALLRAPIDPVRLARVCRRAENEYVGVKSGIMDQLASVGGRAGRALLIDCRDETFRTLPLPDHVRVVLIDSGVKRELDDSSYNERRDECETAADVLGVASLRDADLGLLERHAGQLDEVVFRRARHVITENERVVETAAALETGDLSRIADLFDGSHRSLAGDFEVSTPEVDTLVAIARRTPGVLATRLTGAGFGGCTVQLVEESRAEAAAADIARRYTEATGHEARWWVSDAADGASRINGPTT